MSFPKLLTTGMGRSPSDPVNLPPETASHHYNASGQFVPRTDIAPPSSNASGINGFLSQTIRIAGVDIPVWAFIAAGVGAYFYFAKDDKK